ncbi:DUF4421 family protein [Chitinophaga sp.]|uniref:DUF4421 family protein n=1 Tax=Chitinophaga sp. TaxID=1869181 RepID=UPI00261E0074|nr:DUF4421 family protein [uncultured Chitinophaga sp.]
MPFTSTCLGWIATCASAFGLPTDSLPHRDSLPPGQPAWIEKIGDMATVKATYSEDVEALSLLTPGLDVELAPNSQAALHASFSYRFLSVGFKVAPGFISGNNDNDLKGKTSVRGLGVGFSFRHWQQELSYSRTKGYYLANTADYDPDWKEGMPYLQFPQLVFTSFQGITGYNFNSRFSVNAVLTQTERQRKSAGSFIPLLLYRYYIIDDRTEPASPGGATQRSNNFEVLLGAGYHHTFVWKDFYASLGITPGAGYIFTKLTTRYPGDPVHSHNHTPAFRIDGRAGLGYNGPKVYAGSYLNVISNASRQDNNAIINSDSRLIFRVFVGYRFRAPRILSNTMDRMTEKGLEKLDRMRGKR